jgi:MFS transporter, DHA1 family, inner membrane transport protein
MHGESASRDPQGFANPVRQQVSADENLGGAPSGAAAAGIALGCVGLLMLGLQPLILGALLNEHRLSVSQLTQAATIEQLALGAVAGALGAFAPRRHLRLFGLIGCAALVLGNAGCLGVAGMDLVWCRGISGIGGGILVWIATGIVTFGRSPARLAAVFFGAQAASQCLLAGILSVTLMPSLGGNGGLASLAAISLLSMVLLSRLPSRLPDAVAQEVGTGNLGISAYAGLLASFLFMAGIVGFWVFVDPIGAASGVAPSLARFAVADNLAAQFVGAVLAVIFARALAHAASVVLGGCCAVFLLALALLSFGPHDLGFLGAVLLHGFVWTIGLTFFVPLLIRVDPTRRGAMLLSGAELLGGSAGPQITGWFATEARLTPVVVSAACLAFATLISIIIAAATSGPSGNTAKVQPIQT